MIDRTSRGPLSARGAFRIGRVTRVYLAGTVPVCDVVEPDTGSTFKGCRFVGGLGGPQGAVYAPPGASSTTELDPDGLDGAEVFLFFPAGFHGLPKVMGTQLNPAMYKLAMENVPEPVPGADYPAGDDAERFDVEDYVVQQNGARLIVSKDGALVLDARAVDQPVRVQVAKGQALRVSVEGEATEHTILAGPLMEYLTAMAERVNHLGRALKTAELWLLQFVTGTITQTTPSGVVQTPVMEYTQFTANALTVVPTGLLVQEAQSPGPNYAGVGAFPPPTDLLLAECLQISARSVADSAAEVAE